MRPRAKRRQLGQHYLTDQTVVQKILAAARLEKSEVVLEIGTGRGVLTQRLAPLCARLEAYEVDAGNLEATRSSVAAKNVKFHLGDAFRAAPSFDVLVSSLPYSRSAYFVDWISQTSYKRAVVLLQQDFVEKITSAPGTRNYRAVSVIAQLSSDVRLGDVVGSGSFSPQPKVNSRIVQFEPKLKLTKTEVLFVKRLFALRRRTLRSVLRQLGIENSHAARGDERVYELAPADVRRLMAIHVKGDGRC